MITAKELQRKINRAQMKLDALKEREKHLSKYGYWEMGYFQGMINILQDWLDETKENEELITDDEDEI